MKIDKWTRIFSVLLIAFTVFISLDTFVISSAYQNDATELNMELFESNKNSEADSTYNADETESAESSEPTDFTSNSEVIYEESTSVDTNSVDLSSILGAAFDSYQDENISINMYETNVRDTAVYVADIKLGSAEYLKTAFASATYGKNVKAKTSEIAADNNAILAINGDYYGARESGYVIRNGVIYRDTPSDNDVLCIYADGSLQVVSASDYTAEELLSQGVWQAFSFGPGLLMNGEIEVGVSEETGKAMASNPRTAIGIIDELHYVFVVSDGRTSASEGLSLYELAEYMKELGVNTAYNLDGGGSSTMVFKGELINNPTTSGNRIKERSVSDIVYIG